MKLKEWREDNDRSAAYVAERLGVTRQAVHRYENGQMPAPVVLTEVVRLTHGAVTPNDWVDFHAIAPGAAGERDFPGMVRMWTSKLVALDADEIERRAAARAVAA